MHAFRLTDIFRNVPGLRVVSNGFEESVASSRGSRSGCVQFYLDDMQWMSGTGGDISGFVSGHEVVAVEVYQGPGTPAQYVRGMGGDCVTIVLWTRFKIRD
jgi:hypothetical protein